MLGNRRRSKLQHDRVKTRLTDILSLRYKKLTDDLSASIQALSRSSLTMMSVKMISEGQFKRWLCLPWLAGFQRVSVPLDSSRRCSSSMEGGSTNMDRDRCGILLLYMNGSFYIDIQYRGFVIFSRSVPIRFSGCHNIFLHTPFPIPQIHVVGFFA